MAFGPLKALQDVFFSNERDEISTLQTAVKNVQLHNKVFCMEAEFPVTQRSLFKNVIPQKS